MTIIATLIPPHQVAAWLLTHIDNMLNKMSLAHDRIIEEIIYVTIIITAAMGIAWLLKSLILLASRKFVALSESEVGNEIIRQRLLSKCSHIIPPLVILTLIPFAFTPGSMVLRVLEKIIATYTMIVLGVAICAILDFAWSRFDKKENDKNLPLKGILNVCKGLVWIVMTIIVVGFLVDKSPTALLAGLGAFAAVLSLIFKDTLLGFVAGIQLAENDMLRVGDWIVVPSTIANGICIDVSLSAVKVQNWDNTIVTMPPYTLVSTSFQNYRGMSDSGFRLICRQLFIDAECVKPATPELIDAVRSLPGMEEFIVKVTSGGQFYDPGVAVVNGTLSTNLGMFRAYICHYLLKHPLVGTNQQILVNLTAPTPSGLQLQIYCYTTTAWTAYEAVQSEILEHVASTAPKFGVRIFNAPAGSDIRTISHANTSGISYHPDVAN